ncbi:Pol protein [Phytophthora palmivora]|uniref:Pol protein n=1 Tax=Phytophthora palmivora TaxID=4796 RepID=A0A2P4X962_9STRA|nr:Pol protein [Phytophthora palmivora]
MTYFWRLMTRQWLIILSEGRPTKWSLRHSGGPVCIIHRGEVLRDQLKVLVETCQRVKTSGHASAPLQSLPVPADCWKSMSLEFVFALPVDNKGNTGILAFVCRLSKMVHLAPVRDNVTGKQAAQLFRYHGLSEATVSDQDPRFTGAYWDTLFQLLGTKLTLSTADHPQTDGQMGSINCVLEDTLWSICAEGPRFWSDQPPMVEFALNNAVHVSTGFTPFYLNGLRHPQVPLTLRGGTDASKVSGEKAQEALSSQVSNIYPESLKRPLSSFIDGRLTLTNRFRDVMASAQDKENEYSDRKGRGNLTVLNKNLPLTVVSSVESNKLKHHFIGPFAVLARHGTAYTIDLQKSMATHPTFYVERLKRYHDPQGSSSQLGEDPGKRSSAQIEAESRLQPEQLVSKPVNGKTGWYPRESYEEFEGATWEELP